MDKLLVITGPTAVGKTDLSIKLAEVLNGEIISADSMQIYKDMNIGTAKADKKIRSTIPHHLIDIITPDKEYSVSLFQKDADRIIEDIRARNKIPIIVGGTVLYIKAVLEGFMLPDIEPDYKLRKKLNYLAKSKGTEHVHSILKKRDPKLAEKLHPNDLRRVIRGIEIFEQTGRTKTYYKKMQKKKPPRYHSVKFVVKRKRKNLYNRINQRVDFMIESGLIDEVKYLLDNYDLSKTAKQALGYKEVIEYFNKKISLKEAINNIKKRTRHFAKRQLTWLRKENNLIELNADKNSPEEMKNNILDIIKEQ
ncbi:MULTISPECIES: tRNA (adenosine(37)-N6)-dimethylallyltransferase MiaA [unclassified Halanaerobium]|uniref:tRNA (adenosine(37)-N6)-dimethylallyltransferase MiaA n=1 Tax=unclassified Halanaerobium TaxID=2641197 RepID=UPI000DF4B4ED|nr:MULTISPECIES: tRNA (adenosine(37)-N6)-dimethylallyltransferase MiaA [unclassified Halanaerobium]RCW51491.1 tRNA dimethylallyltransferase [Halanaerobium sp. MA284_MarDTE_T2]RCW89279.1 tRNA dimethylallyltransferase [Halanaerobium sp. DL-01]